MLLVLRKRSLVCLRLLAPWRLRLILLLRLIRLLLLLRVLLSLRAKAEAQTERQRQSAAHKEFRLLGITEARHVLHSCP